MLAGKRAIRVGDQILKEIAILLVEKVRDPRVQGVTLTGVRLSNDLKRARIYFSVMDIQAELPDARKGLESAKGFIKRKIGERLALRYVPDIKFVHDPSLENARRMEDLFKGLNSPSSEGEG